MALGKLAFNGDLLAFVKCCYWQIYGNSSLKLRHECIDFRSMKNPFAVMLVNGARSFNLLL